jgi:hypothetical protein
MAIGALLQPINPFVFSLYVDPGSGSMVLQLLLGGVSGIYVVFRLFKQRILRMFGIRTEEPSVPVETMPAHEESDKRIA